MQCITSVGVTDTSVCTKQILPQEFMTNAFFQMARSKNAVEKAHALHTHL